MDITPQRTIETLTCAEPGCTKTARIHIVERVNKATGKPVKVVVRGATYWGYGPDNAVLCPRCVGSPMWRKAR